MPAAAVDLGSHSCMMLLLDDQHRVLRDEAPIVALGAGLGHGGRIRPDRRAAAVAVIADFARLCREHGVEPDQIEAVATSAARRAVDAQELVHDVHEACGVRLRVISGEEEARLTFKGATLGRADATVAVIDIGGGSTEVGHGRPGRLEGARSLELGTLRITESVLGVDAIGAAAMAEARSTIARAVSGLGARPEQAVAVAGTATMLAAWELGLSAWDRDAVHDHPLTRATIGRAIAALAPMSTLERRAANPVSPPRADSLVAGLLILDGILEQLGLDRAYASVRGMRWGLLS